MLLPLGSLLSLIPFSLCLKFPDFVKGGVEGMAVEGDVYMYGSVQPLY